MSRVLSNGTSRDMQTLFTAGAIGGATDEQLVERFVGQTGIEAEVAFAALVNRHGAMVHDVCRSVLGDWHDAQDAFQATFLVLALRARSIRRGESLGSWLFGVAQRVSLKARIAAARRHAREQTAAGRATGRAEYPGPSDDPAILHEELRRLPEAYRAAIVLYHLEGRSYEQAAAALNCPVGTLKSRLARGRERLKRRLIRRGIVPTVALTVVQHVRTATAARPWSEPIIRSILRFAADRSSDGVVSSAAVHLARSLVRSMIMTRSVTILGLVAACLGTTGAAVYGFLPPQEPAAPATAAVPSKPAEKRTQDYHLRVVNLKGEAVPDVPVQVIESQTDGIAARTDADGRATVAFDARAQTVRFRALQGETAVGWARWYEGEFAPEGTDDDPIILTLLPINHQVEGTVIDTDGRPIPGVRVNVRQRFHPANGFDHDYGSRQSVSQLGSAVTDEKGRYRFLLPEGATASLSAFHPLFVGTSKGCKEDARTIAAWTLQPGGRIVGFVIDGETKRPVANAKVFAQRLHLSEGSLGGSGSDAETDEAGRFEMGSLSTGVYNLLLATDREDRSRTARAVEGVRVIAGEDSRADLTIISPRLLQGTVVDFKTGEPLAGLSVFYYSASHPRSGAACQSTKSDEQGRFVCPVPPGVVKVYLADLKYVNHPDCSRTLVVPADGDVPAVILKGGGPLDDSWRTRKPIPLDGLVRRSKIADVAHADDRHTLRGRVIDRDGLPVAGVWAIAYPPPSPAKQIPIGPALPVSPRVLKLRAAVRPHFVCTDREGTFILNDLSDKPFKLTLSQSHERDWTTTVPADALEMEFTIPPSGPEAITPGNP